LDFCERFAVNIASLKNKLPNANGPALPKEKLYFIIENLQLNTDLMNEAYEEIHWFANEARVVARWNAGILYLFSALSFLYLLFQGFFEVF